MNVNGDLCGVVRKTYRPDLKQNEVQDGSVSDLQAVDEQKKEESDPLRLLKITERMRRSDRQKVTEIPASRMAQLTQLRITARLGSDKEIADAAEMAGLSPELMFPLSALDDKQLLQASTFNPSASPAKSFAEWHLRQIEKTASLPERRSAQNAFIADLVDITFRDDSHSMSAPMYSLASMPTKKVIDKIDYLQEEDFKWNSVDGKRCVEVRSTKAGRATMRDKNLILYAISQLVAGQCRGRQDANRKDVEFTVAHYCNELGIDLGGTGYEAVAQGLDRISGTQIKTNIKTGKGKYGDTEWFGLVDHAMLIEDSEGRGATVRLRLSDWLYGAVEFKEILKIPKEYFKLRKPLEMRLYELARKHCGNQLFFNWTWAGLYSASGSRSSMKEFKRMVREIIETGITPEYEFEITKTGVKMKQRICK